MSPILLGLAVTCWSVRQRWVSRANPRSPRQRRERSTALLVRLPISSSRPPGGCLTGMWMPTRAVVAGIGEGQQVMGGGPVQPWQGVAAGGGEVVHRAGLHVRNPQREPVGGEHRLDVAAVGMGLAGVPQVNDIAFHAD